MTKKELSEKVTELKELKIMAQELADQIASLEGQVKAEMDATHTDTLLVGTVKVMYKPYTSTRFDSKAFRVKHEKLYNQYLKSYEAKRFTVA